MKTIQYILAGLVYLILILCLFDSINENKRLRSQKAEYTYQELEIVRQDTNRDSEHGFIYTCQDSASFIYYIPDTIDFVKGYDKFYIARKIK